MPSNTNQGDEIDAILENLVMQGLIRELDISDFDAVSEFVLKHTDPARKEIDAKLNEMLLAARIEVIEWLETDLKRLDSRNWTMDTLALDTIVGSGKADEHQKSKRQQIVEDRRAAHALYAILNNYKATLTKQLGKTNGKQL